jgi:hypothetical protein
VRPGSPHGLFAGGEVSQVKPIFDIRRMRAPIFVHLVFACGLGLRIDVVLRHFFTSKKKNARGRGLPAPGNSYFEQNLEQRQEFLEQH